MRQHAGRRAPKKKKLEKHRAYLESKKQALGESFKAWENEGQFLTPEERAAKAAVAAGTDQEGAIDAYNKLVQQANERSLSTSWLETWRQMFSEKPVMPKGTTAADLARIEVRLQTREDFCGACNKWGMVSGNHRSSKAHQDTLAWHASCDRLMGETRGPRAYSTGMSLPASRILDEKDLIAFWGDEVMAMSNKAMAILKRTGIYVRVAKSRAQELIAAEHIVATKLAFVEFACGTGKYEDGKARLRWPQALPCLIPPPKVPGDSLTWWPVVSVSFTEDEEKRLAKYMMDEASEDIEFQIADMPETEVGPSTGPQVACKALVLSCQEQLQWDTPTGWYFPTRSRM